jgi:hypothetical protein
MYNAQTVVWGLDGIALKGKKALPIKHLESNQASMPAKKPDCRGAQGRPFPPRPPGAVGGGTSQIFLKFSFKRALGAFGGLVGRLVWVEAFRRSLGLFSQSVDCF